MQEKVKEVKEVQEKVQDKVQNHGSCSRRRNFTSPAVGPVRLLGHVKAAARFMRSV